MDGLKNNVLRTVIKHVVFLSNTDLDTLKNKNSNKVPQEVKNTTIL